MAAPASASDPPLRAALARAFAALVRDDAVARGEFEDLHARAEAAGDREVCALCAAGMVVGIAIEFADFRGLAAWTARLDALAGTDGGLAPGLAAIDQLRLDSAPLAYVQPEMAHTGVSQFMAIAAMAQARGAAVIPHATIGVGIFMAASLHASAALSHCPYHEYQHSVFDRNLAFVDTQMRCAAGRYWLPAGPGLGVVPKDTLWKHAAGA